MSRILQLKSRFFGFSARLGKDRSGVSAVITAIALTTLAGFCGLAVDVVMWEVNYRAMQGAVDQAALAAVTAFRNAGETAALGDSTTAQNAAYATAIRNGYPSANVTVAAFNNGGTCTNDGCLQVTITQSQSQYFTAVFFNGGPNASVTAVATCSGCGNGDFTVSSSGGDPCVMALDAGGNGVITASGTPVLSLSHCNLYNNSPNTNATILNGGAIVEGCTASDACGSKAFLAQSNTPSGSIDIPIVNNASPAPDPYAGLSAPTVTGSCISSWPANPVPSGTYCPGSNGTNNATVQFADNSVIVVTGGLSLKGNSHLSCNSCTVYVTGGGSFNANSTMSLTSPSSGQYAGIALWFGDSSDVTYDGTNDSGFSGAIYAPTATVTYGGTNQTGATCTRLIAASIDLHGTPNGSFDNSGCPAVAGPVMTSSGVSGTTTNTGSPLLIQ